MSTLWLRLQAPFAAWRWMQAGVYRASSPTLTPSAAWGLVLNLAGMETRAPGSEVSTLVRADAPPLCLAIGALNQPEVSSLYQQLHTYPVGSSGKELAERARGAKYWIAPIRRELLVDVALMVGVQAREPGLLERVVQGLKGELEGERYGLPFAGDNNLLFSRIDALVAPEPARWYVRLGEDEPTRPGSCRLTVGIDRADSSRTRQGLYAPLEVAEAEPPDDAWTWVPGEPGEG